MIPQAIAFVPDTFIIKTPQGKNQYLSINRYFGFSDKHKFNQEKRKGKTARDKILKAQRKQQEKLNDTN